MRLSLEKFSASLAECGLLSQAELTAFCARHTLADAEQLAHALVKQKLLTAYQAQQAYAGKAKALVLGNYIILDKLGQGGMGMVLKARHRRMDRIVALKVLSPAVTKTPDAMKRFQREVEAAAKLQHPNIVAAYDADEVNGTHFLVMGYVEGTDLSVLVKKKGPLPVDQVINCMLQAAKGLEYAHRQGVIHRDIKPANLLLDKDGTIKVLDMGLARIEGETGANAELTSTGAVMGTVDYMAPEQALNTKSADARSDIYSLGISLWYLLIGRPVFEGDSLMARLIAHRETPPPSLKGARGEVPAALDALFQKMIAKKPADRFQSMTEVIAALETCHLPQRSSENSTPSFTTGPSEESKLSEFMGLFGGDTDPPAATGSVRRTANTVSAAASSKGTKYEATRTAAQSTDGTDPKTLTKLSRQSASTAVIPPIWWKRRPIQIAAGVAALLLAVVVFRPRGGEVPTGSASLAAGTTPAATSPAMPGASGTSAPSTSAPAQDGAGVAAVAKSTQGTSASEVTYELDFDGKSHVQLPQIDLIDLDAVTMEATVTARRPPTKDFKGELTGAFFSDKDLYGIGLLVKERGFIFEVGTRVGNRTAAHEFVSPGTPWAMGTQRVAGVIDVKNKSAAFFVNGRLVKRMPLKGDFSGGPTPFLLGADPGPRGPNIFFSGRLDEIRLSNIARYSANYPPPLRLDSDEHTLALYHCDEGSGTVLKDSSGRGHHGTVVGATWIASASSSK